MGFHCEFMMSSVDKNMLARVDYGGNTSFCGFVNLFFIFMPKTGYHGEVHDLSSWFDVPIIGIPTGFC